MPAARKIRCPQCRGESLWAPENPWRPFCSERCKQIDLGAWATGSYLIPGQMSDDEAGIPGLDSPEQQD